MLVFIDEPAAPNTRQALARRKLSTGFSPALIARWVTAPRTWTTKAWGAEVLQRNLATCAATQAGCWKTAAAWRVRRHRRGQDHQHRQDRRRPSATGARRGQPGLITLDAYRMAAGTAARRLRPASWAALAHAHDRDARWTTCSICCGQEKWLIDTAGMLARQRVDERTAGDAVAPRREPAAGS